MPDEEFWESYGDIEGTGRQIFESIVCEGQGSLAARVLNFYNINCSNSSDSIGGDLTNLDIKHMDAMQIVKQSLMEHSAINDGMWEPIVNGEGEVEFKDIGSYSSGVEGHIYHQIQTMDYKEECKGVMITGRKP